MVAPQDVVNIIVAVMIMVYFFLIAYLLDLLDLFGNLRDEPIFERKEFSHSIFSWFLRKNAEHAPHRFAVRLQEFSLKIV